jgi:hypothetical protein
MSSVNDASLLLEAIDCCKSDPSRGAGYEYDFLFEAFHQLGETGTTESLFGQNVV